MEPLEFLLGVLTFKMLVKFKNPLRKIAVAATSQALGVYDRLKSSACSFKEEIEDIVAEAQYENMKRTMDKSGEKEQNAGERAEHEENN